MLQYQNVRAPYVGAPLVRALAAAALAALAACGVPDAPRIAHPTKVDSFCGTREARITGIQSVMTSTDDKLGTSPTSAGILAAVKDDGVIAHWNDQLLKLPNVASVLGESDGFARVEALAIPSAPDGSLSRPIYLLVRDHGTPRWIAMTAYDVQNVCVEGKPQS